MIVACLLALNAGVLDAAEVEVAACSAVWSVELTREGSAFRRGDYCFGGRRGVELTDPEYGQPDEHAWIGFEPGPDGDEVILRDSETGPIRARGRVRWGTTAPQPLSADGATKLALTVNPMTLEDPIQVIAVDASVGEVLAALREAAGIDIRSDRELEQRLSLGFPAISANAVLSILFNLEGLILMHDAAGTRHVRTPRDAARLLELRAEFEALALQGDNRTGEQRVLEDIRALVRPRSADDVPPDARYELGLLANAYRRGARFGEQIEIRRELLRIEQRYDARPDTQTVAVARLDLASALDQGTGGVAEAHALVELASPVVGKGFTEGAPDAAWHAETLTRHGRSDLALRHLEGSYRTCGVDDGFVWLLETEHLHFLLVRRYVDADRTSDLERLLDDWRRCAQDQTYPAQAIRVSRAFAHIDALQFAEAARTLEVILLRIPHTAAMDPDELAYLHQRALFANLGAGHWHSAAMLLEVLQDSQAQRPDALKAKQHREQQVLRTLANADRRSMPSAHRASSAPRREQAKGQFTTEPALILDFQALAIVLAAERMPSDANRDDLIAVNEAALILSPVVDGHPALSKDPVTLLRALRVLRSANGTDAAAIAQRERELQRLRDLIAEVWLEGGPPMSH
jgi:hypothetical protein